MKTWFKIINKSAKFLRSDFVHYKVKSEFLCSSQEYSPIKTVISLEYIRWEATIQQLCTETYADIKQAAAPRPENAGNVENDY